jgi:hypothetical protein
MLGLGLKTVQYRVKTGLVSEHFCFKNDWIFFMNQMNLFEIHGNFVLHTVIPQL